MRIGELARALGVSTETVRFYERAGWLPKPARAENRYRAYDARDVEHLRLLIDLRRLDMPLEQAARVAAWCHSGHCADAEASLPALIATHRDEIRRRIERLHVLDERLADLQQHLRGARQLTVLGDTAPCCSAAGAVRSTPIGDCLCCAAADA